MKNKTINSKIRINYIQKQIYTLNLKTKTIYKKQNY